MAEKKYIDADLLQSQIEEMGLSNGVVLGHHSGVADIIEDMISNTSPADVAEVRHGHWERKFHSWSNNTDFGNMHVNGIYPTCNLCNAFQTGLVQKSDYCPNCGARMDGDGN